MDSARKEELVDAATIGNRAALNELLQTIDPELRPRIAPAINAPYRGLVDVDDVLQVTYLEAFLAIGGFVHNGPGSFLAWITSIAKNNIRDLVRGLDADKRPSPSAKIEPGSDESYANLFARFSQSGTTPSGNAVRSEIRGMLDAALAKLPEDYERVIRLIHLQGKSAPEAAIEMNRSAAAVHMLKARASDRLGDLINESDFFSKSE